MRLTKKNGELEPRILSSFIVPGISTYTRHYSNAIVGRFNRDNNAFCKDINRMNKSNLRVFFFKLLLLFLKEYIRSRLRFSITIKKIDICIAQSVQFVIKKFKQVNQQIKIMLIYSIKYYIKWRDIFLQIYILFILIR